MLKTLQILSATFRLAWQELKNNKLRTFLSLFGVTIGIFCIIGVLTTVNSLEKNIQDGINSLGTNTIYIDKWDYGAGGDGDYPWWKYVKRPEPKYEEIRLLREKTNTIQNIAFTLNTGGQNVVFGKDMIQNVSIYGVTEEFSNIQPFDIQYGRYLNGSDMDHGSAVAVIGYENAAKLFGTADRAIGKSVSFKNKRINIVGVIKKQGKSLLVSGWNFDDCLIVPYRFFRTVFEERYSQPNIMVQGKPNVTTEAFKDEMRGALRAIHRLSPETEDDFALNAVSDFSEAFSKSFAIIKLGGVLIGLLSLIVGGFGIANIMFVTVRERTTIIGLKKAIGAKSRTILTEFLLESAFICIIGGLIGLILVFLLAQILSGPLQFNVYISYDIMALTVGICVVIGIVAGIIPATIAARMNPVVAIRSK
ncbi:MAG: ABC transporter permease [Chitinophagaceae bacterium]|nr:ABC transporter permease [Chitinophagaceae bacterium]MCW5925274.1 ABC transporter permease [Chitinophagaceae bacterium]